VCLGVYHERLQVLLRTERASSLLEVDSLLLQEEERKSEEQSDLVQRLKMCILKMAGSEVEH
jgi:septum formation topological specificity factor MinE